MVTFRIGDAVKVKDELYGLYNVHDPYGVGWCEDSMWGVEGSIRALAPESTPYMALIGDLWYYFTWIEHKRDYLFEEHV